MGGGGAGSGGTGGVSGTGGAGGVGGMGGAGGIVRDTCINDPDLDVIGVTMPNFRFHAAFCGTLCQGRGHDLFVACVNPCVENRAPGLSSECTSCYAELAWCAGFGCNTWCANTTVSACTPECTAGSASCPDYSTCLTELNRCAGRDSLDCLDDT